MLWGPEQLAGLVGAFVLLVAFRVLVSLGEQQQMCSQLMINSTHIDTRRDTVGSEEGAVGGSRGRRGLS